MADAQKAFPASINLHKRFESKKPPCIPHAIKLCVEEILDRAKCDMLRVQPNTVYSLLEHSGAAQNDEKSKRIIQELLSNLINERRPDSEKEKEAQRIACCAKYQSNIVLGSLLEFLRRCEGTVAVKVRYPICGWLIIGPPNDDPDWKRNDNRFTQEVEEYLREISQEDGVRKDFFCYIMRFLSLLLHQSINSSRSRPIVPIRLRRILANKFADILIKVVCGACQSEIVYGEKPLCNVCADVQDLTHRPTAIGTIENILQYTPTSVWDESLLNPRPSILVPRDANVIRDEIKRIFYKVEKKKSSSKDNKSKTEKTDTTGTTDHKKKKKKKSEDGEKKKKDKKKKKK